MREWNRKMAGKERKDTRQRLWFGDKYFGDVIESIAKHDKNYLRWFLDEAEHKTVPLFKEMALEVVRVLKIKDYDIDERMKE